MLSVFIFAVLAPLAGARAQQPPRVTVSGSVTDATSRRGVAGVTVWLADGLTSATSSDGQFEIRRVPVGVYQVRVSRIGYRAKTLQVPVAADDRRIFVVVALEPLPIQLEPVVIRGDTNTIVAYGRMADFYRRKRLGFGRFITRQDIERRNPFRVSDLLWGIPGAWIRYGLYGQPVISFRGYSGLRGCQPAVYLDYMRMPSDFGSVDDWVLPQDVEGIEIYTGFTITPMEFYGGCGAIVIWTR